MTDPRTAALAVVLWAAALACVVVPAAAVPTLVVCLVAAVIVVIAVAAGRHRARAGVVVLMLLCCAAVAGQVAAAQPERLAVAAEDGHVVEAQVEVVSSASVGRDGRIWFDAQAHALGPPGRAGPADAPIRVGIDPIDGVDLAAQLRVTGQAKATGAGERAALVLFGTDAEVMARASGVFAVAATTRAEFVRRAVRLPEPGAGLLPGLAVGDTRAVSEQLNDAMLASGLSHLTAVSGANCAVVVAAVFWLVSLLGGGRWVRVVVSLTALAGFVVLVTPEPSVIRAAVMAALAMLSLLLGRPSAGLAMLALAVCVLLIVDPWLAATPGFALSAAATAALLVLSRPLLRGMSRWLPRPLALALSVPLAAQLVCGPIVALFSDRQSLIGVVANLLAAPAAPIATVIGLLACLAAPIPMLADALVAAAWLPAAWIHATAVLSAGLPAATVDVVAGPLTALAVGVLSAAVAVALARPRRRALRVGAAFVLSIAVALGGARMLLLGPLATMTVPDAWAVAACDIGQGDAVLIRSAGRTALVDTGPDAKALTACLAQTATDRIDLLVLTHFDLDHVGAVRMLEGRVGTVLHGPPGDAGDERMLQRLAAAGARVVTARAGMRGGLGQAQWQVLWPEADPVAFPSGNDASVVLDIAGGGVPHMLLLGDLSAAPQRALLAAHRIADDYAVVKVAHHGSADQEPRLYARARARLALISVGEGNDYGHPRAEALALLRDAGTRVYRTDLQGLLLVGVEDDRLVFWTEHAAPDGEREAR